MLAKTENVFVKRSDIPARILLAKYYLFEEPVHLSRMVLTNIVVIFGGSFRKVHVRGPSRKPTGEMIVPR